MKQLFFIIIVLSHALHGLAQTHFNDTWTVGLYGYRINFNSSNYVHDTLIVTPQPQMYKMGKSSICDSAGNLLFQFNNADLFHANGSIMDNGSKLVDSAYYDAFGLSLFHPQSSVILPLKNNKYYLVQTICSDSAFSYWFNNPNDYAIMDILQYNIIDMNANGGLGKVVSRKKHIMDSIGLDFTQMQACRHSNGEDWWLLKVGADSNTFYKYLFTQDSVIAYGKQTMPFARSICNAADGQLQFSQDGSKLATTSACQLAEIYTADFDRCYGVLSNYKKIIMPSVVWNGSIDSATYGLCFSPNGRFIYVTHWASIYQYDTWDSSWYQVYEMDTTLNAFSGYANLQITADNKIFIANSQSVSKQASMIYSPDEKGAGCNFCRKCLRSQSLGIGGVLNGAPNVPNYDLGAKTCWPLQNTNLKQNENEWSVYPNPSSTVFYIENRKGKHKELYNIVGELLYDTFKDEINVSGYAKGIYFIRCEGVS